MTKPKFKITYATLSADNPELNEMFDQAVAREEPLRRELSSFYQR